MSSNSTFTFVPVSVNRGRKWRGDLAYKLDNGYTYSRGYHNSGVDPYTETEYVQLWDPSSKKTVYVNEDYCVKVEQSSEQTEAHRKEYIDAQINGTIAWCKSKKPNAPEAEVLQFAYNVIRKNHPELLVYISEYKQFNHRNVSEVIENTLNWAMGLETRYSRKSFADKRRLEIARKALHNKGIDVLDGFEEAWELMLTLRGFIKG